MKRIAVLGCGLVGRAIVKDLSKDNDFEVHAFDNNEERLKELSKISNIKVELKDLSDSKNVREIAKRFDLLIGAVPGYLGFKIVKEVVSCGKDMVDISFSESDYTTLNGLAKEKNATVIFDFGVAPGMSNILAARLAKEFDEPQDIKILVGGLPKVRELPFEYKIVFSPYDVIEEYTRPARVVENGKIVEKDALSEVELINFPEIGTLEAFNTDGLRSLLKTLKVPNMCEKTLRYPGHAEKMKLLRFVGFFDKNEVSIGGLSIRPLDLTAKLLFPKLQLKDGEEDITVMRVEATGIKNGKTVTLGYTLYDTYNKKSKTTSMARTTAFPAAIISRLLLEGKIKARGVIPPEFIAVDDEIFNTLMEELKKRGVKYTKFALK